MTEQSEIPKGWRALMHYPINEAHRRAIAAGYCTLDSKRIRGYTGAYRWLSNMMPGIVTLDGVCFPSRESAYQSGKCPERAAEFTRLTGYAARELGSRVPLRPDWDVPTPGLTAEPFKLHWMRRIIHAYFLGPKTPDNEKHQRLLIETGDAYLEHLNGHGDSYWGVTPWGFGQNMLGMLHMEARKMLIA